MSLRLLAGTMECRNGNCPTAWMTERGTVVVQGYVTTARTVRVPRDLLQRAARELGAQPIVQRDPIPAPRSPEIRMTGDWFEVAGVITSLHCPAGERAHEVPAQTMLAAVDQALKEAV